ncbi:MAG TPA: hypothetical protein VJ300_07665 [Thermoplasmata archaeon]|nr:hypothetical protein [Thermoplasmata archaeon]
MRLRFLRLRVRPWLFAVTAASALVFASGTAIAGDSDGDEIPDEIEDATARTLDIVTFPKPPSPPFSLSVTSQSVGAEVDDKFRVRYEEGEFDVEYYPVASSGRVAARYSLEIMNLVEWRDSVQNGAVDPGEVTPVLTLGSGGFGARPVEGWNASSADGGNVAGFRIRSNDGGVTLTLVVAQRFLRVAQDKILTPMEVKLDLWANHTLSSTEARVGLELAVDTDDNMIFGGLPWDVRNRFSVDESWINVTGGPAGTPSTVFFSWANEATVNGTQGLTNMTVPEGAQGPYRMYMMYPAGLTREQTVYHVSTLGVVSQAFKDLIRPPVPLGDAVVFVSSFVAVATIVGASMILAKRRRRKD